MATTGDGVDEASLREAILSQTDQQACIPVLLLTDALLGTGEHPATALRRVTGLEAPEPDGPVFGAELYALQSVLGTAVLEQTLPVPSQGVLALNFHHVAETSRPVVREQLRRAADLGRSLLSEDAGTDGLRVLVAFYDGFRATALFGAEECDRLGLRAAFFPIFSSTDPERAQLSDADLADLATRHELGVHTHSHLRAPAVTEDLVEQEVTGPVRRVAAASGRTPRLAAWCGGSRFDAALPGNRALREQGVRQLVSNWSVETIDADGALSAG